MGRGTGRNRTGDGTGSWKERRSCLCRSLLDSTGPFQTLLVNIGLYWCNIVSSGVYWSNMVPAGLCWTVGNPRQREPRVGGEDSNKECIHVLSAHLHFYYTEGITGLRVCNITVQVCVCVCLCVCLRPPTSI